MSRLVIISREPLPCDAALDLRWVLQTTRWAVALECYGGHLLLATCVSLVEAQETQSKLLQLRHMVASEWSVHK